jgi:SAM-dependent methyltransferase
MSAKKTDPDIMGMAMLDYHYGRHQEDISSYSSIAGEDKLPLKHLFRSFDEMPKLEQLALKRTKGKTLDVGCGSGIHALYLQQQNTVVEAIDISKGAVEVCKLRGIKNARCISLYKLKDKKYDTILLLMNGIGLCGKLSKLPALLEHLKGLLNENGVILTDSSDLSYMLEDRSYYLEKSDAYYGEVTFQLFYKDMVSKPFDWVYIDFETLNEHAGQAGMQCTLVKKGRHFDYLAELKLKK